MADSMSVKAGLEIPGWNGCNYTTSQADVKRRNRIECVDIQLFSFLEFLMFGCSLNPVLRMLCRGELRFRVPVQIFCFSGTFLNPEGLIAVR
jgi:hypothetical protein